MDGQHFYSIHDAKCLGSPVKNRHLAIVINNLFVEKIVIVIEGVDKFIDLETGK